jgi:hypothetical protein
MGARRNAGLATAIRQATVVNRLVSDARRRRGGEALERFLARDWPASSTVIDIYGSWPAAHADAFADN